MVSTFITDPTVLIVAAIIAVILYSILGRKKPTKDTWDKHVFPHGDLVQLSTNLWQVHGTLPRAPPRNMTIYRYETDKLLVHSAVCLNEETMQEIEELGDIEIIIVPNRMHRADAKMWKHSYPKALLICPSFSRKYAEELVQVILTSVLTL